MPVQVWDRSGARFYGQLMEPTGGSVMLTLNQAASIEITAPYERWREIMAIQPAFHRIIVTGPSGETLVTGYWHTRDDDPAAPGNMVMGGPCILDELRARCLPVEYAFQDQSALSVLSAILQYVDDWALGDTSLAEDVPFSATFSGETVLDAAISICDATGNFMRCDGRTRSVDVFAVPYDAVVANVVAAAPGVELELRRGVGRVLEIGSTEDSGEIVRAVVPIGNNYRDKTDRERMLQLVGNEGLPAGFSFQQIAGQLCVVNETVEYGLMRQAEFSAIQALSNTEISASGAIEEAGPGYLESLACRRPNDGFWIDGVLEVLDTEYRVSGHTGDKINGEWPAFTEGTPFSLKKEFPYDENAITEARTALANAAVGFLKQNSEGKLMVTVLTEGLAEMPLPGQQVHLSCIGFADVRDKLTDLTSRFLYTGFHGNLVVIAVEARFDGPDLRFELELSNKLAQGPTDPGVIEMRTLAPKHFRGGRGRGRGAAYTVRVTNADTSCGTDSHVNTLTFPEAYPATPQTMEVVPLDDRYTAYVHSLTPETVAVCAKCISGAFDEVNVIVRVREP